MGMLTHHPYMAGRAYMVGRSDIPAVLETVDIRSKRVRAEGWTHYLHFDELPEVIDTGIEPKKPILRHFGGSCSYPTMRLLRDGLESPEAAIIYPDGVVISIKEPKYSWIITNGFDNFDSIARLVRICQNKKFSALMWLSEIETVNIPNDAILHDFGGGLVFFASDDEDAMVVLQIIDCEHVWT